MRTGSFDGGSGAPQGNAPESIRAGHAPPASFLAGAVLCPCSPRRLAVAAHSARRFSSRPAGQKGRLPYQPPLCPARAVSGGRSRGRRFCREIRCPVVHQPDDLLLADQDGCRHWSRSSEGQTRRSAAPSSGRCWSTRRTLRGRGRRMRFAVPSRNQRTPEISTPAKSSTSCWPPTERKEPGADGFWERVATNLDASRLRLLFVADDIPVPLEWVVEFLNAQMAGIEVLAVEIKQFKGDPCTAGDRTDRSFAALPARAPLKARPRVVS